MARSLSRAVAVAGLAITNVARLGLVAAFRSWVRNLRTASPALASVGLLLVSTGVGAVLWTALENVVSTEQRAASVLHVYLADGASFDAVARLQARLSATPGVASVDYLSSEDALARARARPGLGLLLADDSASPFPAELDVRLADVGDVGPVAALAAGDPAVDAAYPTSYDGDAYRRLAAALRYVRLGGGAVLALLLAVALAVCGNSIRSSLLARRDEVRVMWLVGSPAWVVRMPFVVEGAITGALAGLFAAGTLLTGILAATRAQPVAVAQFLPGIDPAFGIRLAATVLLIGIAVGSGSTVIGLRGLRR